MVLRLKGTNSDKAKTLISGKEKELGIYYNEDFDSAAQLVVEVAKKHGKWREKWNIDTHNQRNKSMLWVRVDAPKASLFK